MKSNYMKACLSSYYRFKRQTNCIATEVGKYNADFITVLKGNLIEIEIKVSKADFNNDFKKNKHMVYKQSNGAAWCPNFFYFAVPKELLDHAVSRCIDKPYGVILIEEVDNKYPRSYQDRIKIVKRASRLHNFRISRKIINYIYSRLASEMANLRISLC